jgi:hypothetical protein
MPISTVGDADIDLDSGVLRLTDSLNDQHGAAWYIDKVNVGGGFDTTFTFRITDGWADGLAFLIQNDSPVAIGGAGSEMGYAPGFSRGSQFLPGVSRSVAIEIDTFSGGSEMQTPHISVQTRGAQPNDISDSASIASADLPNPVDGDPHTVRVRYTPGNLEVYFDDVLYIDTPLDLEDINGDNIVDESGCAWLGFTAGTPDRKS